MHKIQGQTIQSIAQSLTSIDRKTIGSAVIPQSIEIITHGNDKFAHTLIALTYSKDESNGNKRISELQG